MSLLQNVVNLPPSQVLPLPLGGIGTTAAGGTLTLLSRMKTVAIPGGMQLSSTVPLVKYQPQTYSGITALWAGEVPVALRGVTLLYDGMPVGTLSWGAKQFALLGKKLIIFPDRVMLDMAQTPPVLCDMGPDVPAMDFICVAGERLCGCRSSTGMIYLSAAGDPTTFTVPASPAASSPWRAGVPSPGAFTACCTLGSAVLFFKSNAIVKLMGNGATGAGAFSLYEYAAPGVAAGAHASVAVAGNMVYYAGTQGLYAYVGTAPCRMYENLTGVDALAGFVGTAAVITEGGLYYVAGQSADGNRHLLCCDVSHGVFSREDGENVTSFAICGGTLLLLCSDGYVYTPGSGSLSFFAAWSAPPLDTETLRPRWITEMTVRVQGTAGTTLCLSCLRGGNWVPGTPVTLSGGEQTLVFPLSPADALTPAYRLCGVGQGRILAANVRVI